MALSLLSFSWVSKWKFVLEAEGKGNLATVGVWFSENGWDRGLVGSWFFIGTQFQSFSKSDKP